MPALTVASRGSNTPLQLLSTSSLVLELSLGDLQAAGRMAKLRHVA